MYSEIVGYHSMIHDNREIAVRNSINIINIINIIIISTYSVYPQQVWNRMHVNVMNSLSH